MTRKQRKARAKRRALEYGNERIMLALVDGFTCAETGNEHKPAFILRHGKDWTFREHTRWQDQPNG